MCWHVGERHRNLIGDTDARGFLVAVVYHMVPGFGEAITSLLRCHDDFPFWPHNRFGRSGGNWTEGQLPKVDLTAYRVELLL